MTKLLAPKLFYCQNPHIRTEKNSVLEMKSLFEKAVAESNPKNVRSADEASLRLFSLYKQATKGDIDIEHPANCHDDLAKAKYDAWASLKGKSIKDAQREFIVLVHELKK